MPVPRTELLPSGRWRAVATIDGRRHTRVFDTEGAAFYWADVQMRRAELAQRAVSAAAAKPRATAPLTLAEFVAIYLHTRALEPVTVEGYRSTLQAAVTRWGDWPLDAVTYADVVDWMAEMSRARGASRPAARTAAGRLKLLRAVYGEAIRMGKATTDPTHGIKIPTVPETPFRVIDAEEEPALLEAARTHDLYLPVLVALDAGLRWAEVFGLHRHRINPLKHRLTVADVLARPHFTPREYPKGKKARTLWMSDRLVQAVDAHLEAHTIDATGLLFCSRAGTPVDYHNFRHRWDRMIKASGVDLPRPTFHDLRHTFGSRLAAAGTPSKEIAILMGHASTATTDLYIHSAGPQVGEAWMRHAFQGAPSPVESLRQVST